LVRTGKIKSQRPLKNGNTKPSGKVGRDSLPPLVSTVDGRKRLVFDGDYARIKRHNEDDQASQPLKRDN